MASRTEASAGPIATKFTEQNVAKKLQEYLKTLKRRKHPKIREMDNLLSDSEYLLELLQIAWDLNDEQLRSAIQQDVTDLCRKFEHFVADSSELSEFGCIRTLATAHIKKYSALSLIVRNITVCFTPEDKCLDKILDEIHKARFEILVQAYTFNSEPIADALEAAHKRGAEVKMLIDKGCSNTSLIARLGNCGIKIQVDEQEGIAHNKVMIIDDACIITGSYNWTVAAENKNSENVVIIKNECVTSKYKDNFLYLESRKTGPSSEYHIPFDPSINDCSWCSFPYTQNPFTLNKSYTPSDYAGKENYAVVNACFTPHWKCLDLILRKIQSAKKSILVQAACVTLKEIARALINAREKGIDVQLLIDESAYGKKGQKIADMGLKGIPIIIDKIKGTAHNKVIIIDDDIVLTGSYNLSRSADNRNSENVIFIQNFYVNQIFKRRWIARAEYGVGAPLSDSPIFIPVFLWGALIFFLFLSIRRKTR